MAVSTPLPLNMQDARQVVKLGRELAGSGVISQGEVRGGLLEAVRKDGEVQTSSQENNAPSAKTTMTKEYWQFMGKRLDAAADVIQQDSGSPNAEHTQKIAQAALKTAEFVRGLSESKERDAALKEQMQVEIQRMQLEAYQEEQKHSEEKGRKQEGFGLGSKIGGVLDEMVQVLGAPFKDSDHGLKAEVAKLVGGLKECAPSEERYDRKATPASAMPVKEVMSLPKQ